MRLFPNIIPIQLQLHQPLHQPHGAIVYPLESEYLNEEGKSNVNGFNSPPPTHTHTNHINMSPLALCLL